jgi:hypothetical protein
MPKTFSHLPLSRDHGRGATRKAGKYLYSIPNRPQPNSVADGIIAKIIVFMQAGRKG